MLRVRWSALIPDDDGRLCRSVALITRSDGRTGRFGEPFSGLVYGVDDDGIVGPIFEVNDGVVTGERDDWIAIPERGLRVDRSSLDIEEDYGPMLFGGAPFTGAAYYFEDSGACTAEVAYADGQATEVSQRAWYESGAPRELVGGGEYTSWFEDGRLQRRAVRGTVLYNLILRDDGRLGGILVADPRLFDLEAVRRLPFADELFLIGRAIDDALLRTLRDHTGLDAVPRLRLIKTSVGPAGLEVLASLAGLAALWLVKNPALRIEDAEQLQARRPGCAVHVEGEAGL